MIFQDPYASLNPRRRVGQIVGEPMRLHGIAEGDELQRAGPGAARAGRALSPSTTTATRTSSPAASGSGSGSPGRSALKPKLIVADEPVSALDVSIQAQIINLLEDLQEEFGLTYIFVAHDLGVVRHVSDRIAVMYLGKIVESAPADQLYAQPGPPLHAWRCSRRCRSPTRRRTRPASRSCSRATCRARSTRRRPAASTPAAPGRPRSARPVEPPLADYGDGRIAACHHPLQRDAEQLAGREIVPESPDSASDRAARTPAEATA